MKTSRTVMQAGLLAVAVGIVAWALPSQTAQAHPEFGCHSCHVPHGAASDVSVPLWNPLHTETTLTGNYTSQTMDAETSAPDGASKLCLSCHDGTYDHVSADHSFGDGKAMGALESNHPISFVYDSALAAEDGELVDPSTLASDILDENGKMQCTSCHDVHATSVPDIEDNPDTARDESADQPNLRWPYYFSYNITAQFCRNCHVK